MTFCALAFFMPEEGAGKALKLSQRVMSTRVLPPGFYGYQWWAMNEEYFRRPVRGDISSAIGLDGQRILIWPEQDIVVVVLTMYQHFANQGYVLNVKGNALNYPNTCKARNNCPAAAEDVSSGNAVPSYDTHALVELIVDLATD